MDAEQAEVRVLEAEVKALKRALEELPAPGEDTARVQKSFQEIYQSDSEGWETSKDLRNNLGNLESELLFLNTLTGINIRKYSKKTENLMNAEMTGRRIKKVLQRHKLSGNCHMITFQVEFQILEVQNKDNLSSVITDLNIIMESTAYSELSEFVSRAEERRDLFMFFRGLHFFVEWCEYRKRTFKHFKIEDEFSPLNVLVAYGPLENVPQKLSCEYKEKYPAAVQLPEGTSSSCMSIRSASQPGFELVIVWRMHIDEEGKVLPKLDLLTQVPQRALELDQKGAVAAAPRSFRDLLGVLGIEAALESLLRLLCAEGSPGAHSATPGAWEVTE